MRAIAVAGNATWPYLCGPCRCPPFFCVFDAEKTVTLEGSVKEFQWTHPHAWIGLNIANQRAQANVWAIELNGPSGLPRDGWKPKTLAPSMNVSVTIHLLRDGTNGGQFLKAKLPGASETGGGALPPAQGATPPAP
jgi:hypothetical protein